MTRSAKNKKCIYCEYKINSFIVDTPREKSNGLRVFITGEKIKLTGWFDGFVGIEPIETEINYCPMCGRKMKGSEE